MIYCNTCILVKDQTTYSLCKECSIKHINSFVEQEEPVTKKMIKVTKTQYSLIPSRSSQKILAIKQEPTTRKMPKVYPHPYILETI